MENFLFHLESWIDSHKFELFSVSQDGLLFISVVLVVELYLSDLDFFFIFEGHAMNLVLKYWFRLLPLSLQNVFHFVCRGASLGSGEEWG